MHYAIENITGSALFGVILIVTDEQGFLRGEVCPYGVSSVSVWNIGHGPLIIIGQNHTMADQDQKQQDPKLKSDVSIYHW